MENVSRKLESFQRGLRHYLESRHPVRCRIPAWVRLQVRQAEVSAAGRRVSLQGSHGSRYKGSQVSTGGLRSVEGSHGVSAGVKRKSVRGSHGGQYLQGAHRGQWSSQCRGHTQVSIEVTRRSIPGSHEGQCRGHTKIVAGFPRSSEQ